MKKFKTEQENFWAGPFGDEYVSRHEDDSILAGNIALFSEIFSHIRPINSLIEFGANIGLNLSAVRHLMPKLKLSAIEINDTAVRKLKKNKGIKVYHQSILNFASNDVWDFVLIKGVLIHLNPNGLDCVYEKLHKASSKYICIAEYYNPDPVEVTYRGHKNKLFKRDFAGEMLDKFPDMQLIAYGFTYLRDPKYYCDSMNWFLLEKTDRG
jgi:pseudaminic acid biosynthesis-associated methylase